MAKLNCRLLVAGLLVVVVLTGEVVCRAVQTRDYESTEQSEEQEVVDELQSFLPVRDLSSPTQSPVRDQDLCATIFCGNGRKCVLENGRPTCGCALSCPDHYKPICGSDGVTYQNPCELHRAACLQNIKIHKHLRGPCPAPPPTLAPPIEEEKPLVCYEIERDQLRQLLIDWMKGRMEHDKFENTDTSYAQVLTQNFRECDQDGDDQLSGSEFIQCVEKNETIADFQGDRPEHGHVLRGLCVDALILMSDTNEDWMLDLEEFLQCMDPNFEPPRKQCSLENKLYEDGAETRVDCNICVCACGNWVCSAMSCDEIDDYNLFEPYDVEQGPLPSKEERYALLRGFMAAEHINLDRIEEEVPPPPVPSQGHPQGHTEGHQGSQHGDEESQIEHHHANPAPTPANTPDTVPEHLPSGTLRPAYDVIEDVWPERTEEEDESHDDDTDEHQPAPEPKPSRSTQSAVGGIEMPPRGNKEADGNEALQEFLSQEGTTTVQPEVLPRHHQAEPDEHKAIPQRHLKPSEESEEVDPKSESSATPTPDAQGQQRNEPTTMEVITPRPTPTPAPPRRFIPVVNFNITVAEHRVIHIADPEHQEEINIRSERISEHQNGPRHGDHHQTHQHHNRKGHHSHHSSHDHHRSRGRHRPSSQQELPLGPTA